jgi:methionine-rich copper-binding protein CopC
MKSKLLVLAVSAFLGMGAAGSGLMHFALSRSLPAADATVPTAAEVRLWFTEAPQAGTVGIRLLDAAGAAVEAADVAQDAQDNKVYSVAVARRLAAGRYSVAWRGVGSDGHAIQGTFAFTVAAAE